MSAEAFNDLAGGIESIATTIALIVGGAWAWHRFSRQQEDYAHIELSADITFVKKHHGHWVVELTATATNKGKVEHRITDFGFDLNALEIGDAIQRDSRWGGQLDFPHEIAKGTFLPEWSSYFFIPPGLTSKYSHITSVPEDCTALLLHCYFTYADGRKAKHSAERTVAVPESCTMKSQQEGGGVS